jgi:hypothetical protein
MPIPNLQCHSSSSFCPVVKLTFDVSATDGMRDASVGALILGADTLPPQYTPWSKHYHMKTIWFRELIKKLKIRLVKIETVKHLGDIFIKALPRVQFDYLRKNLMGW